MEIASATWELGVHGDRALRSLETVVGILSAGVAHHPVARHCTFAPIARASCEGCWAKEAMSTTVEFEADALVENEATGVWF